MTKLRGNVFTESLPSNGYTRPILKVIKSCVVAPLLMPRNCVLVVCDCCTWGCVSRVWLWAVSETFSKGHQNAFKVVI
jgi:hypothetical protein